MGLLRTVAENRPPVPGTPHTPYRGAAKPAAPAMVEGGRFP
ncbi:hypothetical protein QFZ71_000655 [Streptomyces sp. V2I9]|nr:hypothetical protein [Streptomyces sp. V2I9]MDQ0983372.1 hypothetical protein [Streptomyces sp. V2I9]